MLFPYQTRFTKVEGLKTAYVEAGSGFPMILLHGLGGSKYSWRACLPILSKHFRVIALDIKGFGESEHRVRNYALESQTVFLEKFMLALGIKKAHLVGNSMGGASALAIGYYHPDWVDKTVLIDPAIYGMRLPLWFWIFSIPLLRHLLPIFNSELPIRKNFEMALHDRSVFTEENIKEYSKPYHSFWARYTFMQICSEFSIHPGLIEILPYARQEILIIWGREDRMIPLSFGERLVQDLPNAELEVIAECGHIPQEEKPEETCRLIIDFVNR